jgi:hypothetical protein
MIDTSLVHQKKVSASHEFSESSAMVQCEIPKQKWLTNDEKLWSVYLSSSVKH